MKVKILGTGYHLPQRVVENDVLSKLCGQSPDWIEDRGGVQSRHWVTQETAPQLGASAARKALEASKLQPSDIDLIINASGTPAQVMPDGAVLLQGELGSDWSGTSTFSVHSSCISFLSALRIAACLLASQQARHILIVSSEVTSGALDFEQPESAILFGDGAAAVILGVSKDDSRLEKSHFQTFAEGAKLTEIRGGGSLRHPQHPETTDKDNLFQMKHTPILKMALRTFPPFLESFETGLSTGCDRFDWVIPHQASRSGMSLLKKLGWNESKLISHLSTVGNTVAASIPISLAMAVEEERIKRGQRLLLVATGAGFSMGAVSLVY